MGVLIAIGVWILCIYSITNTKSAVELDGGIEPPDNTKGSH